MRALLASGLILAAIVPAAAVDCESYSFSESASYSAARVAKSAGKARFRAGDGTPEKAYLLPGDEVVVLSSSGDMACVVYVNRKYEETFGWLRRSDLVLLKQPTAWKGTFVRDELGSTATLKPLKDGRVDVTVEAYWAMSLETARTGGINEGGIGGEEKPKDGVVHIPPAPEDNNNCEADMRLIGTRYLLVEDNRDRLGDDVLTCAGHNVTFTGLYVRTK